MFHVEQCLLLETRAATSIFPFERSTSNAAIAAEGRRKLSCANHVIRGGYGRMFHVEQSAPGRQKTKILAR